MVLAALVEISGGILKRCGLPNMLLYNLYWPVEFGMLLALGGTVAPLPRRWTIPLMFLFLLGWTWNVSSLDPRRELVSLSVISGALMLAALYLFLLWYGAGRWTGRLRDVPAFWLCLAILLYYGPAGPLLGSINYFMRTDMGMALWLHQLTQVLCVGKFLFMSMACYRLYGSTTAVAHEAGH